jgi:hypothetical protein
MRVNPMNPGWHRWILFLLAFLMLPAGIAAAATAPVPIPKNLYLESVRFAMDQVDGTGISAEYFVIADKERFLATVGGWLAGVAQDPDYLRHVDLLPWAKSFVWTQKLTMEGLTQPKGWTGTAQGIGSPQEWKYDGFVILANFQPASPVTPFHESIHAFTYAINGGNIDLDSYGGPEFISSGYRNVLGSLRKRDATIEEIKSALSDGKDAKEKIANFWKAIDQLEKIYRGSTGDEHVEQLLHAMGGKADWADYRARVQQEFDEAREASSAGMSPACLDLARQLEAMGRKIQPLAMRVQSGPEKERAAIAAQMMPLAQKQAAMSARFFEMGCVPPEAMTEMEGGTGLSQQQMIDMMRGR